MPYRIARPASEPVLLNLAEYLRTYGGSCVVWPTRITASVFTAANWLPPPQHDHVLTEFFLLEADAQPVNRRKHGWWFHAVYFLLADADEPSSCRYYANELARGMQTQHVSWTQNAVIHGPTGQEHDMGVVPDDCYLYCMAGAAGVFGRRWWVEVTL